MRIYMSRKNSNNMETKRSYIQTYTIHLVNILTPRRSSAALGIPYIRTKQFKIPIAIDHNHKFDSCIYFFVRHGQIETIKT
jgi:hypothetical protein